MPSAYTALVMFIFTINCTDGIAVGDCTYINATYAAHIVFGFEIGIDNAYI